MTNPAASCCPTARNCRRFNNRRWPGWKATAPVRQTICSKRWDFLSSQSQRNKKQARLMQTATAPDANSHIPIDTDNIARGSKLLSDLHIQNLEPPSILVPNCATRLRPLAYLETKVETVGTPRFRSGSFTVKVAKRAFAPPPPGRGLGGGNNQGRNDVHFLGWPSHPMIVGFRIQWSHFLAA
jgi:hypothetical protein